MRQPNAIEINRLFDIARLELNIHIASLYMDRIAEYYRTLCPTAGEAMMRLQKAFGSVEIDIDRGPLTPERLNHLRRLRGQKGHINDD